MVPLNGFWTTRFLISRTRTSIWKIRTCGTRTEKFRLLIKDDFKNGGPGISGIWGAGLYAESADCIHWEFAENPVVYSRHVTWSDGRQTDQANCERPYFCLMKITIPRICFWQPGKVLHPTSFPEPGTW